MNTIQVDPYYTLIIATVVLLVGRLLVGKVKILQNFNIPEPVAGGLLAAIIIYVLYMSTGFSLDFDKGLQDTFMLIFFSSIGLSADFTRLKSGGVGLFIFLGVVALFIVIQNVVGVSLASAFGLEPVIGLMTGSITLTGGHGTAGAWGFSYTGSYCFGNGCSYFWFGTWGTHRRACITSVSQQNGKKRTKRGFRRD